MDTSETYQKMCDHQLIQGQRSGPREFLDWYAFGTWLPRQDQIQEMWCQESSPWCNWLALFYLWLFGNQTIKGLYSVVEFKSTEQSMLAFYMRDKHNLTWGGEEWKSREKDTPFTTWDNPEAKAYLKKMLKDPKFIRRYFIDREAKHDNKN